MADEVNFYDRLDEILDDAHAGHKRRWIVDALDALYGEQQQALIKDREDALAENERLRVQLAAFVPPGTLAPGEIPALCGTCTKQSCVPGLPGCARCIAAELERLRTELDAIRTELDAIRTRDETTGGVLYDVIHRAIVRDLADHEAVREIEQRLIQPLVAQLRTETVRANGRATRRDEIAALYADLATTRRELAQAKDVLREHGITDEQLHHTLQRIAARRRSAEQSRIHTTWDGSTP